jgi:tetratricopeptide (TPR) repeat protein
MILAAPLVLWAGAALGADKPLFAPPPAWVSPLPIPAATPGADGLPIQTLLQDNQARLGPDADAFYSEIALKILTPQGLAMVASVTQDWNPDIETLTIHRLNLVRDGKTTDLLAGGTAVTVLRRETSLELATLDGRLTATVQPEGLRVGDVVDLAFTLERRDPVLQGRSQVFQAERHAGPAGRFHVRVVWPTSKAMRWRVTEGLPAPIVSRTRDGSELTIDQVNATVPQPPEGAPARFNDLSELEMSQFQTWSEVSALMAPLYAKAAILAPDSPLRQEAERIRQASGDPKTRAEAALRLVQDQVHYTFLGMAFGGYVPAGADLTWSRRFGDCKGKTALLLALLREVGVEAEPALVSTGLGDGLTDRLPRLDVFDHVFVRARIGGKVYWLDGTRIGDRDLDDIPVPEAHWVLPVRAGASALERVEPPPLTVPAFETLRRIDATGGLDAPAPIWMEQTLRGDGAVALNQTISSLGKTDAERAMREYWRENAPLADPKTVDFTFDDARRVLRLTMTGTTKMEWSQNGDVRDFDLGDSQLGFSATFKREPGPHADAPYAVAYPLFIKRADVIILPHRGEGFSLTGADANVDVTIAGQRYQRQTQIRDGVLTLSATERSLAAEFPASEAESAGDQLRALSRFDVFVRAAAAPASETSAAPRPAPAATPTPQSPPAPSPTAGAGDVGLRGAQAYAARDYDVAIADFTEAARLSPLDSKPIYNRGAAHFAKHEDALALADFNEALRLNPEDFMALLGRAELDLIQDDRPAAERDFHAALDLSPGNLIVLFRRARAYERSGLLEAAVHALSALIKAAPDGVHLAPLLNERCWERATWGHELEAALADCSSALDLDPGAPAILDSRGLVRLRLGQFKAAIDDYSEALLVKPGQATSLFGRGLARLKAGETALGAADLAAARGADPRIDAEFARYGLAAPPAARP